jgi:hypothetical protein
MQEDELAHNVTTGGLSSYMSVVFPRDHEDFDRFITLQDLNAKEAQQWVSAFLLFLRKVLCKCMATFYFRQLFYFISSVPSKLFFLFQRPTQALSSKSCFPYSFLPTDHLSKVTYRHSKRGVVSKDKPKPLLIKSPVHTARIPLLLRLFPKAKFIYMHRNPYEVRTCCLI